MRRCGTRCSGSGCANLRTCLRAASSERQSKNNQTVPNRNPRLASACFIYTSRCDISRRWGTTRALRCSDAALCRLGRRVLAAKTPLMCALASRAGAWEHYRALHRARPPAEAAATPAAAVSASNDNVCRYQPSVARTPRAPSGPAAACARPSRTPGTAARAPAHAPPRHVPRRQVPPRGRSATRPRASSGMTTGTTSRSPACG